MKKRILTILLLVMLVFIWGNSLLSRETSAAISDGLMERMNAAAAKAGLRPDMFTTMYDQDKDGIKEPTSLLLRKAAHILEFTVFAFVLWFRLDGQGSRHNWTTLLLSIGVGAVDEILQIFSHRGSSVSDMLIDAAGAAVGLILALLFSALARRRRGNSGQR